MSHIVVTTTSTTTTTSSSDGGFCNIGYARSFQGLLKIGQVVILMIAFLCVHYEGINNYSAYRYFEVVTAWFLIVFLIFFLMYLFQLQSKITCINWTLTEFLHYAVGGILVFIASIVVAVKSHGISALIAGSVFGFIATFLIAISIWTSYKVTCGSQPTGAAV
ncbi:CKLF-like MARVEL transmembrane domain-containing protein 7 [Sinocyclocheilus anshuiensis]|uniref:CKLF-like MARVEL transmembrane domain-containing protein 7 n=1 Tax=Sinocyclocheilus anshuiensis TaxID=1608454 RepID=A0A671LLF4_9TELE|nr:PREDICTED: CKLF-like MARVEL transmembrane domain-containing protein 7 [Sinocyclocheilus anshuiensis]